MIAEGPHIVLMKLRDIASECLSYIAILQIRIYALYSLNNKLLAVMLFFYFTCSACSAWIVINELSSISSMDSPTSSFFLLLSLIMYFFLLQVTAPILPVDDGFCSSLRLPRGIFRYWIPMLSFECLLCVLVLIQGFWRFRSDNSIFRSGKRLVSNLIRDSVFYFLVCVFYSSCLFFLFSSFIF